MKHDLKPGSHGPYTEPMAEAIQTCVHCGFCLPTCPTYQVVGQESDSPRGRIYLMKEVLEGNVSHEQVAPHIDRCLGCLACETACPSGVKYGELISPFRSLASSQQPQTLLERLKRWLVFSTLPYPIRLRWALRLGALGRWLNPLVPSVLRPMVEMVPQRLPKQVKLQEHYPSEGKARARVALLAGCAQQVLRPEINLATIRVLNRNGVEVVVPPDQGCCGALAWHAGEAKLAKRFAVRNLQAFPRDVDAVVTNAAGCGSGIQDYRTLLRSEDQSAHPSDPSDMEKIGNELGDLTKDISVFLDELGLVRPPAVERPLRVAIQDACHLAHAQRVTAAPRRLLRQVENLELVEIADGGTCCGSAGTYNIDQPEIASQLAEKKAASINAAQPDVVATGNIGCMMQIEKTLDRPQRFVWHTVELLDLAYRSQLGSVARE